MARPRVLPALGLAAGAGLVTYLFVTPHGRRTGSAAADASARWVRDRTPDASPQLARIERQIETLGTDLRRRLDALQAEMKPGMDVTFDVKRDDVRRNLPGMPG